MIFINILTKANGGDEGIRTLDELLAHTPLAGERLRPLGHVSERGISQLRARGQGPNAFVSDLIARSGIPAKIALLGAQIKNRHQS